MKYPHGFVVLVLLWLWCVLLWNCVRRLPISFKIVPLALGQSYDCPSASKVVLKDMGKICQFLTKTKHNKMGTSCIFLRLTVNHLISETTEPVEAIFFLVMQDSLVTTSVVIWSSLCPCTVINQILLTYCYDVTDCPQKLQALFSSSVSNVMIALFQWSNSDEYE